MKIRNCIKQTQSEWKGEELSAKIIGKGLHKVFKAVVNKLKNPLPTLVEPGSEVSHFIPETRNFVEVSRSPADVKKAWLESTLKDIKNMINNQNFIMDDPEELYPMTTCMDVCKKKIKYVGSLEKLKLRIVVRGYFYNMEMIVDTWAKTSSMRNL